MSWGTVYFPMISPLFIRTPHPFPKATPTSASRASPGPFTSHPITATVKGVAMWLSRLSTSATTGVMSVLHLPHVGQDTRSIPRPPRFNALRMAHPTWTSSTGSPVTETRSVSPIPSSRRIPRPTADLTEATPGGPASVMPIWRG